MIVSGIKHSLSLLPLYVKSLAKRNKKKGDQLPDEVFEKKNFKIDIDHLNAYRELCGFVNQLDVPAPYLHLPAFDMQLSLLTHPEFPYASMGMVHLSNTIKVYNSISETDVLDYAVKFLERKEHPKGVVLPMLTTVKRGEELVWEEVSEFLKIYPKAEKSKKTSEEEDWQNADELYWFFPDGLGRKYALISGDFNPIHLYDFTARFFGFKKAIVHGMFTKARAVASLADFMPEAPYTLQVSFKLPLYLPEKVTLKYIKTDQKLLFKAVSAQDERPFLEGMIF
jgi:hypothetical protein